MKRYQQYILIALLVTPTISVTSDNDGNCKEMIITAAGICALVSAAIVGVVTWSIYEHRNKRTLQTLHERITQQNHVIASLQALIPPHFQPPPYNDTPAQAVATAAGHVALSIPSAHDLPPYSPTPPNNHATVLSAPLQLLEVLPVPGAASDEHHLAPPAAPQSSAAILVAGRIRRSHSQTSTGSTRSRHSVVPGSVTFSALALGPGHGNSPTHPHAADVAEDE